MSSASKSSAPQADFFLVATPIGNLGDFSFRAVETLQKVDVIFCEDTRRSSKLLQHYEIQKSLQSCPYYRERSGVERISKILAEGNKVAYLTDAGMPGLCDPGAILIGEIRKAGYRVEVIGGVSALSYLIGLLGVELETFRFVGFLPAKRSQREKFFGLEVLEPTIFFESPHRMESTLQICAERKPSSRLSLAKEISKVSERLYEGTSGALLSEIKSWKGEWVGLVWPDS